MAPTLSPPWSLPCLRGCAPPSSPAPHPLFLFSPMPAPCREGPTPHQPPSLRAATPPAIPPAASPDSPSALLPLCPFAPLPLRPFSSVTFPFLLYLLLPQPFPISVPTDTDRRMSVTKTPRACIADAAPYIRRMIATQQSTSSEQPCSSERAREASASDAPDARAQNEERRAPASKPGPSVSWGLERGARNGPRHASAACARPRARRQKFTERSRRCARCQCAPSVSLLEVSGAASSPAELMSEALQSL
jgi:hypothetical protein